MGQTRMRRAYSEYRYSIFRMNTYIALHVRSRHFEHGRSNRKIIMYHTHQNVIK